MSVSFQVPPGYGHTVSSYHPQQGWLMYANPDLNGPGGALVLHGNAVQFELTHERSAYGDSVDARFMLAGAVLLTGKPVDQMAGEAFQAYPGDGSRVPPQVAAMRELARSHPGEYQALCEKHGLPSLVVTRDPWTGG